MSMNIFEVKRLYDKWGKDRFIRETKPLVEKGEILENFTDRDWGQLHEAVDSGTFIYLIGSRVVLKVREGYEFAKNPLEPIFKVQPSSVKKDTAIGLKGPKGLDEVKEGMNYPAKGIGELKLEYDNAKYGELVEVTWETIKFDRYNAVIKVAGEVGENAKLKEASLAADALYDSGDTGYDGSGIYVSGHGNYSSNTLSATNLETAISTIRQFTDDSSRQIVPIVKYLCVPEELRFAALKIVKSTLEAGIAEHNYNVLKDEGLQVISIPWWTDDDGWVLVAVGPGGTSRGYVKNEVLPLEIYTKKGQMSSEGAWFRDIECSWKCRLYCNYHCEDYRYGYRGKPG